jgi:hypothetical protein
MLNRTRRTMMHCPTVATVSAAELLRVTTVSVDAHPAGGRPGCELVAGHDGSHIAFAAAANDGDQWWWLRWDGQSGEATELVQIDPCDAVVVHARYPDDCMLPHGHAGPHSFDLPVVRRAPVNAVPSAYGPRRSGGGFSPGPSADPSEVSPQVSSPIDRQ